MNEIFNEIMNEALTGRINCFFYFNMLFNTKIPELNIDKKVESDKFIPTLIIKNITTFNTLLTKYVEKCLEFYKNDKYLTEIVDNRTKIKLIMTLLWSNATIEDFNNPENYLSKRLSFLENDLNYLIKENKISIPILNSILRINVKKSLIVNETPYYIELILQNEENNEEYHLPNTYLGLDSERCYIYAMQTKKQKEENKHSKKINRLLYKINDNMNDEDLKDVTMSFVLAANMILAILKNNDINNIQVVPILITRWNAKASTYDSLEKENEHNLLQANITDKFLRTFQRLVFHHSSINIESYPYELDTNMHLSINGENICNNSLLEETFNVFNKTKTK